MALIIESAVYGDRGNGGVGLAKSRARLLYSVAVEVLYGSEVKALLEVAFEGAERKAADLREVLQFYLLRIIFANVADRQIQGGSMKGIRIPFKFTGDTCESANFAFSIEERDLVSDVPLNQTLRGGDQFDLVTDGNALFDDAFVVNCIAFLDVFREKLGVGSADYRFLALEAHEVGQLLIDVYKMAVGVLNEEEQAGNAVE